MAKPDPTRAFAPPDFDSERGRAGVAAIKHLQSMSDQAGRIALDFIINEICRTYDLSFRPEDKGGERETSFAEGRRFAGVLLERILRTSYDVLTKKAAPPPR